VLEPEETSEIRTKGLEQRHPLVVRAHDVKPGVSTGRAVTVTAFACPTPVATSLRTLRYAGRSIVISGDTSRAKRLWRTASPATC